MTIHEAGQRLLFQLYDIYDNREAGNIADLVMEYLTDWKKIDRILNKQLPLLPGQIEVLEKFTEELLAHKPVQYVLHEAWFYGMRFYVNEHVLIPRPETEELVEWIISSVNAQHSPKPEHTEKSELIVLDIGTGSGCISIALKKQVPAAETYACDVSKEALEVAKQNAILHSTNIHLLHTNFLDSSQWDNLPSPDIIVSNPPYIPLKDRDTMRPNVLQYEPHVALFVEDNDPLLFYRAIADFAKRKLSLRGNIFAEIHEELSDSVHQLFVEKGFKNIQLKKDMQGKNRMIGVRN